MTAAYAQPSTTDPFRVVIAGGGVAALEATLALRTLAQEPLTIEVVAPEPDFVYRPLSVADPFCVGETRRFPLRKLVEAAGARLRPGRLAAVEPDRCTVALEGGGTLAYEALLVALGARPAEALPGAMTFSGPESSSALRELLEQALAGEVRRIAFALPGGVAWPLPVYELALLTRSFLVDRGATTVEVLLVTPEERPLALFGTHASEAIEGLLADRGVECHLRATPLRVEAGVLSVAPSGTIAADRVVALPRLEGPRLAGLPSDPDGFLPIDAYCRVGSEPDVFAAGDATSFPLKQGGIAAQQADVAASEIARGAGSDLGPSPFKPVLRGLLLTGMTARFLRAEPGRQASAIDTEALWWPPAKIVGRHLSPFLAAKLGLSETLSPEAGKGVPVDIELETAHDSARI
jgi:sulfide:quinone oxidoreductase